MLLLLDYAIAKLVNIGHKHIESISLSSKFSLVPIQSQTGQETLNIKKE
jgi:hypothetical protein